MPFEPKKQNKSTKGIKGSKQSGHFDLFFVHNTQNTLVTFRITSMELFYLYSLVYIWVNC